MPERVDHKDNEQDSRIAYLEAKFGSYREKMIGIQQQLDDCPKGDDLNRLYAHIDKLETRVKELDAGLRGRIRKNEMWIAGAGAVIASITTIAGIVISAESMEVNYGSNGSTKQEVLLQFPSSGNK